MEEVGAVEFARIISENAFTEFAPKRREEVGFEDRGFQFLWNDNHAEIINVETFEGKNTRYSKDFYESLKYNPLHVDVRSFDEEDNLLKNYDVVISYLEGITDMNTVDSLVNTLSNVCKVGKVAAEYSTHRLSLVSETLFDKPSIIIYLNEGAIDLYYSIAEEFVVYLLARPVVQKID